MLPNSFVIADDNGVYRNGLAKLLNIYFPGSDVTQTGSGDDLLHILQQQWCNVVLINVHLLPQDGFKTAAAVLQQFTDCRVVLYAHTFKQQYAVRAFVAGAAAFSFAMNLWKRWNKLSTRCLPVVFV